MKTKQATKYSIYQVYHSPKGDTYFFDFRPTKKDLEKLAKDCDFYIEEDFKDEFDIYKIIINTKNKKIYCRGDGL